MKVLFCTDGSKISYSSIINFSKWFKDFSVDILTVADWNFFTDTDLLDGSKFISMCESSSDSVLEFASNYLTTRGMKVNDTIKRCGSVGESIMNIDRMNLYDYIVMGSNGKKGMQKWLGSVSQETASRSSGSVYIAKNLNSTQKILFCIEPSDYGIIILKKVLKQIDLTGKEIHLLNVFEMPDYLFLEGNVDPAWIKDVENQQVKYSLSLLENAQKVIEEFSCKVKFKSVLNGNTANEIINYCNDVSIDLIVSGMKDRKFLARFLTQSVSRRVLEHVKSDMLIFKL